jgi:hypothetical protein
MPKNSWLVVVLIFILGYIVGIYFPATGTNLIAKVTG